MIFTPPTQHALRALIYLANHGGAQPVLARVIADSETIPRAFLSKILHRLRMRGLLVSTMGPGGGYALARPAGDIRMSDVIDTFDELRGLRTQCILGRVTCSGHADCPLHQHWRSMMNDFSTGIANLTLAEIAAPMARPEDEGAPARRKIADRTRKRGRRPKGAPARRRKARGRRNA